MAAHGEAKRIGRSIRTASLLARLALATGAGLAGPAQATWSILVADTRTGEVVLATATCLTGQDMVALTPVMLTGVGACTAQSAVETSGQNRSLVRNMLLAGASPQSIITALATFDSAHQTRQYGIVDTRGGAATFSGRSDGTFAGGRTGQVGDFVYAVQGNVITGPCVLDVAVAALAGTQGSLGDKVIAAMEAVRLVGGDGRCSCNVDAADSCGCPPPSSPASKAAHVGVMMISRAGNEDRCNGVVRVGNSPGGIAAADLNGDGLPEVVSFNSGSNNLTLLRNATPVGGTLPALLSAQTASLGVAPRSGVIGDFTGDGVPDAMVVSASGASVFLLRGSGGGQFTTPATIAATVGTLSQVGVPGDFDGDGRLDLAVTSQTGNSVWLVRGTGTAQNPTFSSANVADLGTGAAPIGMAAGEFGGGPALDLAVATSGRASVSILTGNGDGTFTRQADVPTTGRPTQMVSRDFDGDGAPDLAFITSTPSRLGILYRTTTGWTEVSTALTLGAGRIVTGDFDGDGRTDLGVGIGANITVFRNLGNRVFAPGVTTVLPATMTDMIAADLDRDGRADLITTASSLGNSLLVLKSYPGGVFDGRAGCANGSYYFESNIANQQVADPDPVIQLTSQYNAFKATKAGVPDAIRSAVTFDRECLFADGGNRAIMRFDIRDLASAPVSITPGQVTAFHSEDSAGICTIGAAEIGVDGAVQVVVNSAPRLGVDRFVVRIAPAGGGGGGATVDLMPAIKLRLVTSPDFDADGIVTADDLGDFISCYFSGSCAQADANHDGDVNGDDLGDVITQFFAPCS